MDPIITTAIVAALANLSKDVIKDSYNALKAGLKTKLGEQSDLVVAVTKLEMKPDSEARKAMVQEEVESAKVYDDPDILRLVQELLDHLNEQPERQKLNNQTMITHMSGVNVGGNLEFNPVMESK
jgi:hypothetical protein